MAGDRLEKMKAIAAQAQAEKEAKTREEAERAQHETEAKGVEREQVEQEFATASQELANLESQLAEAETLADGIDELPKEFSDELTALRTETAELKEQVASLNERKQKLDAELGSEPKSDNESDAVAPKETDAPAEPVVESTIEEPSPEEAIENAFESSKQEIIAQAQAKIDSTEEIPEAWKTALKDLIQERIEIQKPDRNKINEIRRDIAFGRGFVNPRDLKRIADPEIDKLTKEEDEKDAEIRRSERVIEIVEKGLADKGFEGLIDSLPKELQDGYRDEYKQIVIPGRKKGDLDKDYKDHVDLFMRYVDKTKDLLPKLRSENQKRYSDVAERRYALEQSTEFQAMDSIIEDLNISIADNLLEAVGQRQTSIYKLEKAKTDEDNQVKGF